MKKITGGLKKAFTKEAQEIRKAGIDPQDIVAQAKMMAAETEKKETVAAAKSISVRDVDVSNPVARAAAMRARARMKNMANTMKKYDSSKGGLRRKGSPASAEQAEVDAADDRGFFRRHWKGTAIAGGTVLSGLALTVGIARASMAGGEKTNSELYNPQQQNY